MGETPVPRPVRPLRTGSALVTAKTADALTWNGVNISRAWSGRGSAVGGRFGGDQSLGSVKAVAQPEDVGELGSNESGDKGISQDAQSDGEIEAASVIHRCAPSPSAISIAASKENLGPSMRSTKRPLEKGSAPACEVQSCYNLLPKWSRPVHGAATQQGEQKAPTAQLKEPKPFGDGLRSLIAQLAPPAPLSTGDSRCWDASCLLGSSARSCCRPIADCLHAASQRRAEARYCCGLLVRSGMLLAHRGTVLLKPPDAACDGSARADLELGSIAQ